MLDDEIGAIRLESYEKFLNVYAYSCRSCGVFSHSLNIKVSRYD